MGRPGVRAASAKLAGLVSGGVAAAGTLRALTDRPPGGSSRWLRVNHRGDPVSLLEGPAYALGTTVGLLLTPGLSRGHRLAAVSAVVSAGALGAYDDLHGSDDARGLGGHLAALVRGEVTTGAVKIVGLALTGLVSARLAGFRGADALTSGAVVAGAANLVNLLDLRPGRALKVAVAHSPALVLPGPRRAVIAAPIGAAAAMLGPDLRERTMLGDTGANALGAALGVGVVTSYGRLGRLVHLAAIVALTLASERVSFTKVIESTPPLAWADRLGRRGRATA